MASARALAHTLAYDGAITSDRTLWTERARSVRVPTLVLDSDASPEHLRVTARAAAEALPTAHHRTIAGGVHDAPAEIVAPVLTESCGISSCVARPVVTGRSLATP